MKILTILLALSLVACEKPPEVEPLPASLKEIGGHPEPKKSVCAQYNHDWDKWAACFEGRTEHIRESLQLDD